MRTAVHVHRPVPSIVAPLTGALMAMALLIAMATPVFGQDELSVVKSVAQVNGQAPAATEVISVLPGDTVAYAISVSSAPGFGGTDVTVTDVFDAQVLQFEEASTAGCTAEAAQVSCTVTLDDTGATELMLTFSVLEVGECQRLVNTVEVVGDDAVTASAEAEIEACSMEGGAESPAPGGEGTAGSSSGGGSDETGDQPDTALARSTPDVGLVPAFLGIFLVVASGIAAAPTLRAAMVRSR